MMREIWKPFKNYEGSYSISNFGNVKNEIKRQATYPGKILKPRFGTNGYRIIHLCKKSKHKKFDLHRAVAQHFIGLCPRGKEVNHIDGNKLNNKSNNLEYLTHAENCKKAGENGLMPYGDNHWSRRNPEKVMRGIKHWTHR